MGRRAAFFDVDGTLTTRPTLFAFLVEHLVAHGRSPADAGAEVERLRGMSRAGVARQDVLRACTRHFAGTREGAASAAAARWYGAEVAAGGFYREEVVAALRRHRAAGDLVVLVSGSFPACLDPVAAEVGADVLLCSRPRVRDGRYTGELPTPLIGASKVEAVRALVTGHDLDLSRCAAYGDHVSDIPLLAAVGRPVVVGDDPGLTAHARRHGWSTSTPVPASTPEPTGRQ
ncbi:HAD family hydrolase [Actinosynnema sp. NPDC053489]|uniref:HAD family hydrolase n=1 Tax=Actinosynnema sp. NPDC053489 TaxID=3363916 RepID=UPI0037C50C3E